MKSLLESETSSAIQARIEGLQEAQIPVVNRLRKLGVPNGLAETDIIDWAMEEWSLSEEGALLILNGKATPVQEC